MYFKELNLFIRRRKGFTFSKIRIFLVLGMKVFFFYIEVRILPFKKNKFDRIQKQTHNI